MRFFQVFVLENREIIMTTTVAGTFTVESPDKSVAWGQQFTSGECDQVDDYMTSRDSYRFVLASLTPIRTNTWKNLWTDTLLPNTLNHAIEVNNVALRVLAIGCALVADIVTLPIRLVTLYPRIRINNAQPEHPLLAHLKTLPIDRKLIDTEFVWVNWVMITTTKQGNMEKTVRVTRYRNVNYIERPLIHELNAYSVSENSKRIGAPPGVVTKRKTHVDSEEDFPHWEHVQCEDKAMN